MTTSKTSAAQPQTILALDVGSVRIGVASARLDVGIPQPLTTLRQDDAAINKIVELVAAGPAERVVVGWPRGLEGQSTRQTASAESFVASLKQVVGVPVELQDEALTSRKAEAELQSRGKPFDKSDIDALAATYILEDYLQEHPVKSDSAGAARV